MKNYDLGAYASFNSRSREGSDLFVVYEARINQCFNSRSREGSDTMNNETKRKVWRFNSRSREGSDAEQWTMARADYGFNSRSREGSDRTALQCRSGIGRFQFALPRGERPANNRQNG